MSEQHTPGPWTYGVRPDGSIWLSIGDFKTGPHYQGDLVATPQDAQVICAAPDLLAALSTLVNMHHSIDSTEPEVVAARAAIAKATGEQA